MASLEEPLDEGDKFALLKLRDESEALKEHFADSNSNDPRDWKGGMNKNTPIVAVEDGRLTTLDLSYCKSLAALPAAIGKLTALTTLNLSKCESLTELAAIGELGALTRLNLSDCMSLAALPLEIGKLTALTTLDLSKCDSLTELAVIGELGALTDLYLRSCHRLTVLPDTIGKLDALTTLNLSGCEVLTALPDEIGNLVSLTRLSVEGCSKLVALPLTMHQLDALTKLNMENCTHLIFPPTEHRSDPDDLKMLSKIFSEILDVDRDVSVDDIISKYAKQFAMAQGTYEFWHSHLKDLFFRCVLGSAPFADRLEAAVRSDPTLADLKNNKGQRAIEAATDFECRRAMQRALFFLGRYEIADGAPEHRSATSLVVRALDYEAADDYERLFKEFDNGDGTLDANELDRLAAKLGTNVEILKLKDGESYTKDAFVAKCKHLFGKERKVVIKIFQKEEQWRNEEKSRKGLDAEFVVQTIEAPDDDKFDDNFKDALKDSKLFTEPRFGGSVGSHAIVMDAADRNLLQIYQSERPDLNAVRTLMQQVMECVQHLHEKGLVHGDIKMLNVVRLSLDNKLRMIDLDAAAKISDVGKAKSYVGSKFSSAVLPPECFAKLSADQVKQFNAYFQYGDDAELREKVAPKVDEEGASYVVKTFQIKGGKTITEGLPYTPMKASVAVDYWSLGALLFQLVTNKPLVPSNRDDDCVDGNSMKALASWDDDTAKSVLSAIKDPAARDLASQLLLRDPDKRGTFSIADALATHPFFKPPKPDDEAAQKKLDTIIEQQKKDSEKLDTIKADTSAILELSLENRIELQRTRQVLLKAVFEATEVTTPTTFVVLNEELPEEPQLTEEQVRLIEENIVIQDDGTVEIAEASDESTKKLLEKCGARLKEATAWADQLQSFIEKPRQGLTSDNFVESFKTRFGKLWTKGTLYFYLVDELTGKPVRGDNYPIQITQPGPIVSKLLPVMQVGIHAMTAYNGVAGLVQMFGYPAPKVPKKIMKYAQQGVNVLGDESSVEAFGAIHEKVVDKDGKAKTVRGAPLRELEEFFRQNDSDKGYAGLRRIGDPDKGTAVWTCLEGDKFEDALSERTKQWRAEHASSETKRSPPTTREAGSKLGMREAGTEASSPTTTGNFVPTTAQPTPQEQNADPSANALTKHSGGTSGTCNNMTCYCTIA